MLKLKKHVTVMKICIKIILLPRKKYTFLSRKRNPIHAMPLYHGDQTNTLSLVSPPPIMINNHEGNQNFTKKM